MFDIYMLFSFVLMGLIFLRQISIFKKPNKINYAPLMLGVGAIASVIHFIISPETQTLALTLKGSFIPFLVALMLYIIMNIMHQTQVAENERIRTEFTHALVEQLSEIKGFTAKLELKMVEYAKDERELRDEFMFKFNQDIQTLEKLLNNQEHFIVQLEDVRKWHHEITELFVNFTEIKLPELDSIIHKHIDVIRIIESEHYEKIRHFLGQTLGDKQNLAKELKTTTEEFKSLQGIAQRIAKEIVQKTTTQLSGVSQNLEQELKRVYQQSEMLKTALYEGEGSLEGMKKQTAFLINQMVLIAQNMSDLEHKHAVLNEITKEITPLVMQVQTVQEGYKNATKELMAVASSIEENEHHHLEQFSQKTQQILRDLDKKVDDTLEDIKNKYVVATDSMSDSVKILAKKAQAQQGGYTNQNEY